jgi:hypothetical protein
MERKINYFILFYIGFAQSWEKVQMPRTNVNSAPVEAGHGNVESLALHPDDVLYGNLAVLKKKEVR